MTLKTYSNKNQTLGMLTFTIRQNLGLIILSVVAVLLVCPGYVTIRISDFTSYDNIIFKDNTILTLFSILMTIASSIGVFVYNIINFNYLYSKKASDVFHAVPLTRFELLLSRATASLISIIIPIAVGYLSMLLVALFTPLVIVDIKILFIGLLFNLLTLLISWSVTLFFIVCAGSVFDFILSFGIINVGAIIFPAIISFIADEFLYGFSSNIEDLMKYPSPFAFAGFSFNDFWLRVEEDSKLFTANEWIMIIVSIIIIAVFTAAAMLLYKRRNTERAENAYAFKFIYIATNIILSLEVGFGVGMLFSEGEFSPVFYIFAVFGALICAVAFGALTKRGFKGFKRSLVIGGSAAVAIIILIIGFAIDIFGFENNIPKAKDIISVKTDIQGFTPTLNDDFETVLSLHKAITDKKTSFYEGESLRVILEYNLKGGKTLKRRYYNLPVDTYKDKALKVIKRNETEDTITLINAQRPKYIHLSGELFDNSGYFSISVPREEFLKLLSVYERDNDKISSEIFINNRNFWADWGNGTEDGTFNFCVEDSYKDFINSLNELIDKYSTEENIQLYGKD